MRNAATTAAVEFVGFLVFLAGAAAVLLLVCSLSSGSARASEFPGCTTDMECEMIAGPDECTTDSDCEGVAE